MSWQVQAQTVFQSKNEKTSASEAILELKDGILLIRFAANEKKLEALEKSLANARTSADSVSLNREVQRTVEDASQLQNDVVAAMNAEFGFCDYAFFFDKDTRSVREGGGPVYGPDLKTEVRIDPDKVSYIKYVGRTPEMSINGFVIVDSNLENIPRPFPGTISRSGFSAIFGNDQKHIRRLNKKLEKYYDSAKAYNDEMRRKGS